MERVAGRGGNNRARQREKVQDRVLEIVQAGMERRKLHSKIKFVSEKNEQTSSQKIAARHVHFLFFPADAEIETPRKLGLELGAAKFLLIGKGLSLWLQRI